MPTNILSLGVPGTTPGILQPKQGNHYIVTFQGIGGGVDSQALTRQCISVTKPSISFNEIELNRYNSRAYIAGKYSWEPIDMIIEDDISNTASTIIYDQVDKQTSLTTGGAIPLGLNAAISGGAYKFNSQILVTAGDGSDGGEPTVIERWTLQGCWFVTVTGGDLSWEADDPTQISVNMRFDHATIERNNDSEPASALVGA